MTVFSLYIVIFLHKTGETCNLDHLDMHDIMMSFRISININTL